MKDVNRYAREIDSELQGWCETELERKECYDSDQVFWAEDWYKGSNALYRALLHGRRLDVVNVDEKKGDYIYAKIIRDAAEDGGKKVVSHLITHPISVNNNFKAMINTFSEISASEGYKMPLPLYVMKDAVETAILLHDYSRNSKSDRTHGKHNLGAVESVLNTIHPRQPGMVKAIKKAIEWHDYRIPESEGNMACLIHHFLYLADKSDVTGVRGLTCVFEEEKFNDDELKSWPKFLRNLSPLYKIPYIRDALTGFGHAGSSLGAEIPDLMRTRQKITMNIYEQCMKGDEETTDIAANAFLMNISAEMIAISDLQRKIDRNMDGNTEGIFEGLRFSDVLDAKHYKDIWPAFEKILYLPPKKSEIKSDPKWRYEHIQRPTAWARLILHCDENRKALDTRINDLKVGGEHGLRNRLMKSTGSLLTLLQHQKVGLLRRPLVDDTYSHLMVFDYHARKIDRELSEYQKYAPDEYKKKSASEFLLKILPYIELTADVEEKNENIAPCHGC